MRMSLFVHVFLARVRTRCLSEFVFALVDSVGRDATAADVGGATPLQLMLKMLNRRALSAWRSHGKVHKAERRSRRICRGHSRRPPP